MFIALKCKHCIYRFHIARRTGAMSREVFNGRTVRQSEGSWTAKGLVERRMADGGWRMADGSFYFFLEPPLKNTQIEAFIRPATV